MLKAFFFILVLGAVLGFGVASPAAFPLGAAKPEPKIPEHKCCHNGECCGTQGCCDKKGCHSAECPKINKPTAPLPVS